MYYYHLKFQLYIPDNNIIEDSVEKVLHTHLKQYTSKPSFIPSNIFDSLPSHYVTKNISPPTTSQSKKKGLKILNIRQSRSRSVNNKEIGSVTSPKPHLSLEDIPNSPSYSLKSKKYLKS